MKYLRENDEATIKFYKGSSFQVEPPNFVDENISMEDVDDVIISTVVPSLMFTLQHMAVKYFDKPAIVIESGVRTGLIVKYDNPKQIGADRIVNAGGDFWVL